MSLNILQNFLCGGLLDLDELPSLSRISVRASGELASVSSRLEVVAGDDGMESEATTVVKAESDGIEVVSTVFAAARGETASTSIDVTATIDTDDHGSVMAEGSAEAEAEAEAGESLDPFATAVTDVQATGPDLAISKEAETTESDGDHPMAESFTFLAAIQDGLAHWEAMELSFMAADELSASTLMALPVTG